MSHINTTWRMFHLFEILGGKNYIKKKSDQWCPGARGRGYEMGYPAKRYENIFSGNGNVLYHDGHGGYMIGYSFKIHQIIH